jgi:hypothetical protein
MAGLRMNHRIKNSIRLAESSVKNLINHLDHREWQVHYRHFGLAYGSTK